MIKLLCSIPLLLMLELPLQAQENLKISELTVVSLKGLNMRTAPNQQAQIIYSIPFMHKVTLLHEETNKLDTLKEITGDPRYPKYILGEWMNVRYKNYEGYVFNAYLNYIHPYEQLPDENEPFGLNYAGENCTANIHQNKKLIWKGVYKLNEGYEIRDVELDYYRDRQELTWYGLTTNRDKNLQFLIGSMNDTFKNGKISGKEFQSQNAIPGAGDKVMIKGLEGFSVEEKNGVRSLVLFENGIKQTLLTEIPDNACRLLWKGDLDGDGKNDYVISHGEKGMGITLFLSSQAEDGNLLKPVARYNSGYCC